MIGRTRNTAIPVDDPSGVAETLDAAAALRNATTSITVDSESWPVNIVTVRGAIGRPMEHSAAEELCRVLHAFTLRKELYANIVDLTTCGGVPPIERQFIAESFEKHARDYHPYLVAVAAVVRSSAMRGVLTAIGWVHPYPCPIDFVASIAAGEQALKVRLSARGVKWSGLGTRASTAEQP